VEPRRCDLAQITREQVELAGALTDRHAICLDVPATVPATACDPDRVAQVLSNLLTNAIKHTVGGEISVSLAVVAGRARLTVGDRGVGIPPELRPRVFRPGFRLRGRGGADGSGLGLHIAAAIVRAHGGRIWIEDAHPGARFVLDLPLDRSLSAWRPARARGRVGSRIRAP
jgi:signal transduction histidine kinase